MCEKLAGRSAANGCPDISKFYRLFWIRAAWFEFNVGLGSLRPQFIRCMIFDPERPELALLTSPRQENLMEIELPDQ